MTHNQFFLPKDVVAVAWEEMVRTHIAPSRLLEIARELDQPALFESQHLVDCASCCDAYHRYKLD